MVAVPEEVPHDRFAVVADAAEALAELGAPALEQEGAGGAAGAPDVFELGAHHSHEPLTPET